MRRDLDALSQNFDVLVIGAGIHGACIARLAAMTGLRTALIEKGDFSGATSRNSAKLVHGGLRYIQHFDVRRIRESMVSQRAWFRFAPHLVRPLRFIIPTYGYATRGPIALAGGVVAFHMIAAGRNAGIRPEVRLPRSGMMSRRRLVAAHPALDRKDVTAGAFWHDGQMLDASRLTIECVWDAVAAGAVVANHVASVSLLNGSAGVQGAVVRDALSGRELEVRAALTINATGPWVDRVLQTGPSAVRGGRTTLWTRNINLVTRRLYPGEDALGVQSQRASDAAVGKSKRLFFTSPWHGCTVIGTTHDLYGDEPDAVAAPDDVVAGFLQEVNDAAPGFRVEACDVRSLHIGLTPSEDAETERAKRSLLLDHEAVHKVPGLVSVAGIKYTTAPVVAAKTVELACRKLQRDVHVPDFEQPAAGTSRQLSAIPADDDELAWAARIYGTRATECLAASGTAARDAETVFRSRVLFGIEQEMVVRLADALLRATDWAERGLLTQEQFSWCAATLASSQGWSQERTTTEITVAQGELDKLHISVLDSQPATRSLA